MRTSDIAIVGGGIVGCAVARELRLRRPDKSVVILEKEDRVGAHTSSRNSGVIHSGINQKPGTLKANLCVRGSLLLKDFCRRSRVTMKQVGTVVLARTDQESGIIRELERRAKANSVPDVRIVDKHGLRKLEPYALAEEALISPTGAIVDTAQLVVAIAADAAKNGVSLALGTKVKKIVDSGNELIVRTSRSDFHVKFLVNCAGLYADRVAWMMDAGSDFCVVPFRGDYYRLKPEKSFLVNSMIYPAPNLELPFLGIHLTRRTDDAVIVGPNASLALGREKYRDSSVNWREALSMLLDIRFARMMSDIDFLRTAMRELRLSVSKKEFVKAAKRLVPAISENDLMPDQSGIRAQLVDRKGDLVDDFVFERTDKSFHVLNAVSPAMTSALAFAEHVADLVLG
jgi:L-2-hydroxyglutarate oxidase